MTAPDLDLACQSPGIPYREDAIGAVSASTVARLADDKIGLPILAEPPTAPRPVGGGLAIPAVAERPSAPPLREQERPI